MSPGPSRAGRSLVGLLLLVAGFLCLNYTKGFDMDHHVEWAAEHGLPAPSQAIWLAGVVLLASGALVIGHAFGRVSRPPA